MPLITKKKLGYTLSYNVCQYKLVVIVVDKLEHEYIRDN